LSQVKPGSLIHGFEGRPSRFESLNKETILFLKVYNFSNIKVFSLGIVGTVEASDLFPGDEVLQFKKFIQPITVRSQKDIEQFLAFGFERATVSLVKPITPVRVDSFSRQLKHRKVEVNSNLKSVQDDMEEAEEIIETGKEMLSDLFTKKKIEEKDLSGTRELAKNLVKVIQNSKYAPTVLSVLKTHDEYTYRHCIDVANQVLVACDFIGKYSDQEMELISFGGILHDIGKSKISLDIINKPGPLDDKEWAEMRKHPEYGASMMAKMNAHFMSIGIVHYHHVKKNGTGYPKVAFNKIGELAKLTAISDVYQALVTKRPYKATDSPSIALGKIREWAKEDFDTFLVDQFIKSFGVYPIGSLVLLEDQRIAFVVDKGYESTKPVLAIIVDDHGRQLSNAEFIDLASEEFKEVKIAKSLDHQNVFKHNAAEIFQNLVVV